MLHQFTQFVIHHWLLLAAFVVVLVMLIMEEVRAQSARGYVSVAEATALINREDALIVDLRDANAFRDGHIINSKNIPLVDFSRQMDKLSTHRERAIILVDASGLKTHTTAETLRKAGWQKVSVLKGGFDFWKSEGMPVIKGQK